MATDLLPSQHELKSTLTSSAIIDHFFVCPRLETAHSMPPESAGSRSPGWRCRGVGVASTGPAQPFFACGVLILPNCRHTLCCTAEWWRRECAGEAGRSRRPRRMRACGAHSTGIHYAALSTAVQPRSRRHRIRWSPTKLRGRTRRRKFSGWKLFEGNK